MATSAIRSYLNTGIKPVMRSEDAEASVIAVKLPASKTYPAGTIMAEKTGNNEKASITIDATGGTFTMTYAGKTTAATAFNASAATVQANLEALATIGAGNVSVQKIVNRYTLTHSSGTDGGTFGLRIRRGGVTREIFGIAWNETGANIDALVEALDIIGTAGVAVTGSAGGPFVFVFAAGLGQVDLEVFNDDTADGGVWEGGIIKTESFTSGTYLVEFVGSMANLNTSAITTTATSLTGGAGTATVAAVTAGASGVNEVVTLTEGTSITAGTFTLSFGGWTTTALAHNANAATIQAALEALPSIGTGNVVVTGAATGITSGAATVTFTGQLAGQNVGAITSDQTALTGTFTIAVATAGVAFDRGIWYECDLTATDGTQFPRGILKFDYATDSDSNITAGQSTGGDEHGAYVPSAAVYTWGYFSAYDLKKLSDAKLALFGRMVSGSMGSGGTVLIGTK